MEEQQGIPVVPAGPQGPTQMQLRPHRGGVVLALGILGIVCCFVLGIIAWVMGNSDLKEMAAGRMDPSGQGLTQAGKICGMVSVLLQIMVFVFWLLFIALGIGSASLSSM
jgi:formate hydrogenlyase subunit 4